MPRNGAGFDCRAQRIMANWMLSILNTPKDLGLLPSEYDQPVREVVDSDPQWMKQQAHYEAKQRLEQYAVGVTGEWCPPDDDILDPKVVLSPVDPDTGRRERAYPQDDGLTGPRVTPDLPYEFLDGVPDHAHFIATDTTDPPGRWIPRRPNWKQLIATREAEVTEQQSAVIDQLQGIHLTSEISDFALEQLPMGLWLEDCQSTPEALATPTTNDLFPTHDLPLHRWLTTGVATGDHAPLLTAHIHSQARGEAVFRAICQNCHGKGIDSRARSPPPSWSSRAGRRA